MFRRPRFRPMRHGMIAETPIVLRKANELSLIGNYAEAAALYEQLAHGAQARGFPQDAHLFISAGHCRVKNRQIDLAMQNYEQGLAIIGSRGRKENLLRTGQVCVRELSNAGYGQESQEIRQLIQRAIGLPAAEQPSAVSLSNEGNLPEKCDDCGGVLRTDEVDWIDEQTAECPWCGSSVKTT